MNPAISRLAACRKQIACLAAILWLHSTSLHAQDAVRAGRFHVEHPTLLSLGFEWSIEGDANRNAAVTVRFRPVGGPQPGPWRDALPLVRIGGENVYRRRENLDYTVPHGFAGSILNLQPGTEYECQLALSDPDGTSGETNQTVRVKTRTEPQPYKEGRRLHVYPPDYFGPREEPPLPGFCKPITARASGIGQRSGNVAFNPATPCSSTPGATKRNDSTMSIQ